MARRSVTWQPSQSRGDEAELFEAFSRDVERITRARVTTSEAVVDDACAFAWVQFIRLQPERERGWRSWLVVVAEREAWRLDRIARATDRLEAVDGLDERRALGLPAASSDLDTRADVREALEYVADLPERRRDAIALQLRGLTYNEIATDSASVRRASPISCARPTS